MWLANFFVGWQGSYRLRGTRIIKKHFCCLPNRSVKNMFIVSKINVCHIVLCLLFCRNRNSNWKPIKEHRRKAIELDGKKGLFLCNKNSNIFMIIAHNLSCYSIFLLYITNTFLVYFTQSFFFCWMFRMNIHKL